MSVSMQKTHTGEPQCEPKGGCGVYFTSFLFLLTWRKVRLANTNILLEKQKAAIGIKDNPASCHQVELLNHSLPRIFAPSTSFSICRHQRGQRTLMQLQLLGHPRMSVPKVPLPGSVLVPHLHTVVAVLNELR